MYKKPPKTGEYILGKILRSQNKYDVLGDFEEIYNDIYEKRGLRRASIWYFFQILKSFPFAVFNKIYWSLIMFRNCMKIAFRNLKRNKIYSFINITGLAAGFSCSFLILLYVIHEYSYDTYHKNSDRIYRIIRKQTPKNGETSFRSSVPFSLAASIGNNFPEVERIARLRYDFWEISVRKDDNYIREHSFYLADNELFDILSMPMLKGGSPEQLNDPFSVVLTEEMAQKYFGEQNPVGKILPVMRNAEKTDLTVTGVIRNFPENSTVRADFIGYFTEDLGGPQLEGPPLPKYCQTFVLLSENTEPEKFERKLLDIPEARAYLEEGVEIEFQLQRITDIYLHSSDILGQMIQGNVKNIYLFSLLAFLILIIAAINYIILSTACSMSRAREMGMRIVAGAERKAIVKQVLGESVFLSFVTLPLALLFTKLILPLTSVFFGINIVADNFGNAKFIIGILSITVFIGLFSGSYLAFSAAAFNPVDILRDKITKGRNLAFFRKLMVTVQLIIFITLIICTAVIRNQIQFANELDLGFNKENLVYIRFPVNLDFSGKFDAFKNEVKIHPNVLAVTRANGSPVTNYYLRDFIPKAGKPDEVTDVINLSGDFDYIETFEFKLKEGRTFSKNFSTDVNAALLNETAVRELEIKNPIGKKIKGRFHTWNVIGIVKDFNFRSVHSKIPPMIISMHSRQTRLILIRIQPGDIQSALSFIETKWKEFAPHTPFEYNFIEEEYRKYYNDDTRFGKALTSYSMLAVLIASLGLFGLSFFTAQQRTKEIGIRKVLGAKITDILKLITKEFFILAVIANIIAWPAAYVIMSKWLDNFAYRITITIVSFVTAGILSIVIVLCTVTFNALKTAKTKPVDSLKYE